MMNPFGLLAAQLAPRETAFYVTPDKTINDYDTVASIYPTMDNIRYGYGECFTPSGNVLIGLSYMVYPLGSAQGVYTYVAIDNVNYWLGYDYFNGVGWTQIIAFNHVVTGLDKYRKHTFQWRVTRTAGTAYIYHGPTYESHFWGMDFPAKMFAGPPSQTIP